MTDPAKLCPECTSDQKIFTLKLIPTNKANPYWPKYIPQIKEICGDCGRYIRFAPQTTELIDKFNKALQEIKVL